MTDDDAPTPAEAQLDYDEGLAALSPASTVPAEIFREFERYLDTRSHESQDSHDDQEPAQSWTDYFAEALDVRRAYGVLAGDDAHLNLNLLDPATGAPRRPRSTLNADDDAAEQADVDELWDVHAITDDGIEW